MIWAFVALAFGGIVKGALGAGVPIIAIPILTMTYDVQFAVAVLLAPNLVANLVQVWSYRADLLPRPFLMPFALGGSAGVAFGTYGLTRVPQDTLSLIIAFIVFVYVALRLFNPRLTLPFRLGQKIALPVGVLAGTLQGATGMSAPISVTFLNALGLERRVFVGTIAVFFTALTLMQIPALALSGILTWERGLISLFALATVLAFMPLGAWLASRLSRRFFDITTLLLLVLLAAKIIVDVLIR
ncbi:sulfite exporter TauE/SafE family protein [Paracoccus hibiscisoli]|uniref:sulfite exporter TauE/SafE family protein n=1 Tax=Paracoccus hibiscisoli TaxID=2023261 RepID=UPI0023F35F64|nr:sulfite exporter TauE/SafE family protein [Paracoccus hibiscisoli]